MVIQFEDLSGKSISELWKHGANKEGWPREFASVSDLQHYIDTCNAEGFFVRGEVKGVWANHLLAGFTTLHEIEPGFTQPNEDVFEGGTYLLPSFRGLSLNEPIKQHLVSTAFHTYGATWCVFCIPVGNQRALRAMDKLHLPFERITITDANHALHRYLKWKAWKTGHCYILYAARRSKFT